MITFEEIKSEKKRKGKKKYNTFIGKKGFVDISRHHFSLMKFDEKKERNNNIYRETEMRRIECRENVLIVVLFKPQLIYP